jgi:phosphatidylserine/phosphatidylglycerophosphate/cardiolipin synthase-like enzyme
LSERPTSGPLSDKVSELTTQNDAIQVYFAPCQPLNPLGVDDALVSFIGSARRSVYCAFYDLQLDVVAEALIERHKLGIPVRIVTDSDYMDREALKLCTQAGIPVAEDSRKPFMHNKFCVVDGEKVWTGSTNVTENCMYKNNNNALAITSVDLAEDYAKEFMEMFERREFGDRKSWGTPRPEVLVGNVRIECFFSPEDRVLKAVIRTVNEAKATIDFMAFSFTSQEIAEAMASRVNKGVRVRGLFEGRNANSQYSQDDFLEQKGAKVYLDENENNMHNKVIIVDTETVITGSYNFSDNAEKNNDENLLILHSTDIAAKYEQEFNRLTGN